VSGLLYDPEEWRDILTALKDGRDDGALNTLRQRDMRADGQFQVIDEKSFTPVLSQVTTSQTIDCDIVSVEGIRIGPWVQLNVQVEATAAGAGASGVYLSLPTSLPALALAFRPLGNFFVYDLSADVPYEGAAVTGVSTPLHVSGMVNGTAFGSSIGADPSFTIASGDRVGFSVQYLVDPEAL
jgi:hypothetical protein